MLNVSNDFCNILIPHSAHFHVWYACPLVSFKNVKFKWTNRFGRNVHMHAENANFRPSNPHLVPMSIQTDFHNCKAKTTKHWRPFSSTAFNVQPVPHFCNFRIYNICSSTYVLHILHIFYSFLCLSYRCLQSWADLPPGINSKTKPRKERVK